MPTYFLDAVANGLCFNVRQAFTPQTSAWSASSARRAANSKNARALLSGTVVKHPAEAEHHA